MRSSEVLQISRSPWAQTSPCSGGPGPPVYPRQEAIRPLIPTQLQISKAFDGSHPFNQVSERWLLPDPLLVQRHKRASSCLQGAYHLVSRYLLGCISCCASSLSLPSAFKVPEGSSIPVRASSAFPWYPGCGQAHGRHLQSGIRGRNGA